MVESNALVFWRTLKHWAITSSKTESFQQEEPVKADTVIHYTTVLSYATAGLPLRCKSHPDHNRFLFLVLWKHVSTGTRARAWTSSLTLWQTSVLPSSTEVQHSHPPKATDIAVKLDCYRRSSPVGDYRTIR